MKKIMLIFLLLFAKSCFSYCQPAVSTYDVDAFVNGTMTKEISCQKKKVTIKNHMLVDLWVYHVTYDETAIAKKSKKTGVISDQYIVEDSRKDKPISIQAEKNSVDLQSLSFVLSHQLATGVPISRSMTVFSEDGPGLYQFKILSRDEKIKTSMGVLDTIVIEGKCDGDKFTYWFWKKNYSMVQEDIARKNDSVMKATIASQSTENGCCWN